jgi:hypothetical protein
VNLARYASRCRRQRVVNIPINEGEIMAFKSYRDGSRGNWGTDNEGSLTMEQIKLGCLLHIADSLETIPKSIEELNSIARNMHGRINDLQKRVNSTNRRLREVKAGMRGTRK